MTVSSFVSVPVPPAPREPGRGQVTFAVGSSTFAVEVDEVLEVLRGAELPLLTETEHRLHGRAVLVVDARGRATPVLDLRSDPDLRGDVLVPVDRSRTGLVVDRVLAVLRPGELVEEPGVPAALPSYGRAVLRPADDGPAVLLVALPPVPDDWTADPLDEPALGSPVDLS